MKEYDYLVLAQDYSLLCLSGRRLRQESVVL